MSYSCGKKGVPRSCLAYQEAGVGARCLSLFQNREKILLAYAGDQGLRRCSTAEGGGSRDAAAHASGPRGRWGGGTPAGEEKGCGRQVLPGKSRRMLLPHLIWTHPLRYNTREITACPAHREIPSERTEHPRKGRPGEMRPRDLESELLPDPGGGAPDQQQRSSAGLGQEA